MPHWHNNEKNNDYQDDANITGLAVPLTTHDQKVFRFAVQVPLCDQKENAAHQDSRGTPVVSGSGETKCDSCQLPKSAPCGIQSGILSCGRAMF